MLLALIMIHFFCCCPCFCFVSGYKLHLKSLDSRSLSIHFTYWLTQIKLWVLDQPLLPCWLLLQCKNYNYLSTFFVVALFFLCFRLQTSSKCLDSRSLSIHFTYWLTQINLWVLDQLPFVSQSNYRKIHPKSLKLCVKPERTKTVLVFSGQTNPPKIEFFCKRAHQRTFYYNFD